MSTARRALERFVEKFWPEAKAEIIREREDEVVVDFYGHMCYTCGVYDYFDDFRYILEDESGSNWRIEGYKELEGRRFQVTFKRIDLNK